MPVYEYEHTNQGKPGEGSCERGRIFEVKQSMQDAALTRCPHCKAPVKRILSAPYISSQKSNSELRDLGFTKLVKRDDGVYENVTRRDGESRYMHRDKPETIPHLHKTISD
ncbi:MAG: transcriptional regulator [Deltaproteobacteria bacterium SG8_13]|nr:MAG: transcriptional regulator [Deltaproteobacteria bacterium SG8_13]